MGVGVLLQTGVMDERAIAILLVGALVLIGFIGVTYYYYSTRIRKAYKIPLTKPGSLMLVEGRVDSKKMALCHTFLKDVVAAGGGATILASKTEEHLPWMQKNLEPEAAGKVSVKAAELNLTELGYQISDAVNAGNKAIFVSVVPVLLLREKIEKIVDFIRFNADKTKPKGVYLLFSIDPTATPKETVSTLEVVMDFVLEVKSEGGEFVRVRKNEAGEAEADWRSL